MFKKCHRHRLSTLIFTNIQQAREDPENAPVVLWMTGGPGCSSELAVFYENGPWSINEDLTLDETKYGWDRAATLIYVDQPINTGFSYSDDDRDRCYDEDCVANDMLDFLEELWKARPELQGKDFYITGESYAGHYCPAVAYRVFEAVKSGEAKVPINLKGVAIGNGLTVPSIQYGAYAEFAFENNLISEETRDTLNYIYPACRMALEICNGSSYAAECILGVQFCTYTQFAPILIANPGINVYDYRKECIGELCYDFSRMEEFLNLESTRKKLGVGDRWWQACDPGVHEDMMGDWGHSFDQDLVPLLEAGVRIMIYAGDKDIICNWLGNRWWVDALEWSGRDDWLDTFDSEWMVDNEVAGWAAESGPLSFVKVSNAGHMVPMDQPKNALEMIKKFTRGEPLVPPSQLTMRNKAMRGWKYVAARLKEAATKFLVVEEA